MQKLVVVGQNQQRLNSIENELREFVQIDNNIRMETIRPSFLEGHLDEQLQFLVFDTNIINRNIFPIVVQVRKAGFLGPILVLGQPGAKFDFNEFNDVKNLFHLPRPYEASQLVGFIKNCLNSDLLPKRKSQRFAVNENAILESYASDYKTETIINDISKGGVRILGNLTGLKKGDLLRLHFNFDQINSERVMSARVVWLKKESDNKEHAGLEFVSQKAVYKYLLDYAVA